MRVTFEVKRKKLRLGAMKIFGFSPHEIEILLAM